LLFVFGLARGVPLLFVGAATATIKAVPWFTMRVPQIERVCDRLLLLAALYFLYQSAAYAGLVAQLVFPS
jgi:cytochrome c-type biogenesis protein